MNDDPCACDVNQDSQSNDDKNSDDAENAAGDIPKLRKDHDLLYRVVSYSPFHSPECIFIPSDYLLFKMMKACIGAQSEHALWIY